MKEFGEFGTEPEYAWLESQDPGDKSAQVLVGSGGMYVLLFSIIISTFGLVALDLHRKLYVLPTLSAMAFVDSRQ